MTATGDRRNDERLVDGALHEAAVEHRARVRVEAARERGIARAGHDETRVRPGCGRCLLRRTCRCARCQDRGDCRDRADHAAVTRPERAARAGLLILPTPFGSSPAPAARGGSSTDSSRHPRPGGGSLPSAGLPSRPVPVTFTRSFQCGQGVITPILPAIYRSSREDQMTCFRSITCNRFRRSASMAP